MTKLICTLTFLLALSSSAQNPAAPHRYKIRTIAGAGRLPFNGENATASTVRLMESQYLAIDASGNIYVSDLYYHRVLRISADGFVDSVAGNDTPAFAGDNGPAWESSLNSPGGIAIGPGDELYICDTLNLRIRKVAQDGTITTVAGNGRPTALGDGGPATEASIGNPHGIAFDNTTGAFFISDVVNQVVRRVDPDGTISTVAGNRTGGFAGDNGPATAARLNNPKGLAYDPNTATLYIADQANHRIRKVTNGVITTLAGTGITGFSGDNGPATAARLTFPIDVKVADTGRILISDRSNGSIRSVGTNGIITTIRITAASNVPTSLTGGLALEAGQQSLLFVNDVWRNIVRVDLATSSGIIVAGGGLDVAPGDQGPATDSYLVAPVGVALDAEGNIFVADSKQNRVRRISAADGIITTVAGNGLPTRSGDTGLATAAGVGVPFGLTFDPAGNLYISAAIQGTQVRKVAPDGIITNFAGTNGFGFAGDGGPANGASLFTSYDVFADQAGNVFIADTANHRIRRVDGATGIITTVAGNGVAGYSGDDGPATQAQLSGPIGVTVDADGNVFIADTNNHRVRKVEHDTGLIRTFAGTGVAGVAGDNGPAVESQFNAPRGIRFDYEGNLIVSQPGRLRMIDTSGMAMTIAGVVAGAPANGGPDSLALGTVLNNMFGVAPAPDGSIYIVESGTHLVRKLEPIPPPSTEEGQQARK